MAVERMYFEDLAKDESIESPAMTVTEAHVSLYRGLVSEPAADPHAVPELLPLCLATGLGWRVPRAPLAILAFMGLEWQVVEPLRVGDTIHGRSRPVLKRSMREGGVVIEEHEIIDQRGRVVSRGRFTFLVAKRPASGGMR
jgi:hypothetical protein